MTLSYCGETVRSYDPDRFLLSLFAKPGQREALWTLYAFNHEIAKTREVVTETQLGLIRLQWWRDAIGGIYAGAPVPAHEVLQSLAAAIKIHHLPQDSFDALVYAREFDIEDRPPASLDGLVSYAEFTAAPLLHLAVTVMGQDAPGQEDAIKSAAIAYALTGLLRAIPAYMRQRRCLLPEDLIAQQGIAVHDLYDGKEIDKLKPVVKAIAHRAGAHLSRIGGNVPTMAAMTGKLASMYLKRIEQTDYDVLSPIFHTPPLLKELRLSWFYLRRRTGSGVQKNILGS